MSTVFLKILNLTLNASWLIIAVIITRALLRKAPRWISCLLWGFVGVRLICPFSFESALSLLPSGNVVPENIALSQTPRIKSGVVIIDSTVNPVIEKNFTPQITSSVNPMQVVIFVASIIWITGLTLMLLYALISFVMLKRKVAASVAVENGVLMCDEVRSPFILGVFRPVIYVPSTMTDDTIKLVIAHENAHLSRHDHWWKPLGFVLLSVYWFNPLSWLAYILLCRDIEAACDEKVIHDKDREYVVAYSQALLDCSIQRKTIAACPLAFGETGVKERIKGVLNYKKPAFWVIIVAVVACIAVALCFLTEPKETDSSENETVENPVDVHTESINDKNEHSYAAMEQVTITRPQVDLSVTEGADPTEILYADKDRIIFSGYYGLFVYSKSLKTVTNAIDLEAIGCAHTQGDDYCEKFVSADGIMVYLHPMSSKVMYVYNTAEDTLSQATYDLEGIDLHNIQKEPDGLYQGNYDIWPLNGQLYCTELHHGDTLRDLSYADLPIGSDKLVNTQSYPLLLSDDYLWIKSSEDFMATHGIDYVYKDGQYIVHGGDMTFKYMKELIGRDPNARYDGRFVVLTNDPDMTYEKVAKSLYSSNSEDWLTDTIIITMDVIDENGDVAPQNPIGLSMYVKNVTSTGCTLVFNQSGGNVTGELQTGEAFQLQVPNLTTGEWIDDSASDIVAWKDIAYTINQDDKTEIEIDWSVYYGIRESGHYRIKKEVMDFRGPGDYDTYDIYWEFSIDSDEKYYDWVYNMNLPGDYELSDYMDIGWQGGFLILPKAFDNRQVVVETEAPLEWQYSGMLSRIPADSTGVTYKNGLPGQDGIPMQNHTESTYIDTIPLERRPDGWYMMLFDEKHDLYTAADIANMESKGIDTSKIDLTSEYWTFYYVKEGEPTYYILSLSTKDFSQDVAIKTAGRIKIK